MVDSSLVEQSSHGSRKVQTALHRHGVKKTIPGQKSLLPCRSHLYSPLFTGKMGGFFSGGSGRSSIPSSPRPPPRAPPHGPGRRRRRRPHPGGGHLGGLRRRRAADPCKGERGSAGGGGHRGALLQVKPRLVLLQVHLRPHSREGVERILLLGLLLHLPLVKPVLRGERFTYKILSLYYLRQNKTKGIFAIYRYSYCMRNLPYLV